MSCWELTLFELADNWSWSFDSNSNKREKPHLLYFQCCFRKPMWYNHKRMIHWSKNQKISKPNKIHTCCQKPR